MNINKYPYTDFHELNLDWFLAQFKTLTDAWDAQKVDYNKFKEDVTTEFNNLSGKFDTLEETVQSFTRFITNYFDNLDVQQEINNKLDELVADGTMTELIRPIFDAYAAQMTQRMNVLEGRMDTFASLPEGSTAGNAELLDIRVGGNGVTYPSAGDAVRAQYNINHTYISNIINLNNLFVGAPFVENKFYAAAPSTNENYSYFRINVTTGKTYQFRCKVRYISRAGEVIKSTTLPAGSLYTSSETEDIFVTVMNSDRAEWAMTELPVDVYSVGNYDNLTLSSYLLAQSLGEDKSKTVSQKVITDAINNIVISPSNTTFFNISKNMIDPGLCISGELVDPNTGEFSSNSNHNRTGYINVDAGTVYVLRGESGALRFRYAFYDDSKHYISDSGAYLPEENDMLVMAPENASFIAISCGISYPPAEWMLAKYINNDKTFEKFGAYLKPEYLLPEDGTKLFLNLPEKIYATEGIELNIYFSALTENWDKYSWKILCDKGMQFERGFRFTPVSADVGTCDFSIYMFTKDQQTLLKYKTVSLVVTAKNTGSGESRSIIVLGDSTTNSGTAIRKLHDNFTDDPMTIVTLGTRGTAPNNHEGRSGWSLRTYFNNASVAGIENPFYNPNTHTFDADYYFTNSGIPKPDWFFINMGINDMFDMITDNMAMSKAIECAGYIEDIITSVQTASPTTLMGVCVTIPPNDSQDAFGKAYGANRQTRDRYKRNNLILAEKIITYFSNREEEGIFIIPIFESLDTIYNMGMESIPVNSRNTTTYESPLGNGGVHPSESGYWQIADVYTAFLKGTV